MHGRVQKYKIKGTIGQISITDENILAGSLTITNQCSGSENIEIGQVYIGELNCTFLDVIIGRNSWQGQQIKLQFGQCLADGCYEFIPLGVFTVSEANYTESGVVVKAYDNMSKLDKMCTSLSTGAVPYSIAKTACSKCGLTLENTEAAFSQFPNGQVTLGVHSENDISTYRDVISWLAQTCCCFVTASRTGGIIFKTYGGEPVDTIDNSHRFKGCSFSDFSTRYTGMSVVNTEKMTTSYYSVSPDNALTYNLGSNPYLQIEISHSLSSMRTAILTKLAQINYVPFKATCIGNPAYDLGDVLVFSNGIADSTKQSVITKYSWTYGRYYVMEGVGKNPALATGKSKSNKNIAGLINRTGSEVFKYTVLRNELPVNIEDGESASIMFARYLLSSPSHVRFNFEVLLTATANAPITSLAEVTVNSGTLTVNPITADTSATTLTEVAISGKTLVIDPTPSFVTVKASYKSDGQFITSRYPIESWQSGKHILTLQYDLELQDSLAHTFELYLEVSGGSVSIAAQDCYEVISSTGLAADNSWEGTFRDGDGNLYIVIGGIAYKIPDKIKVHHLPNKLNYETNECIDYTGLIIHAVFGDGTETDITSVCIIDPRAETPFDELEDDYADVKYVIGPVEYATGFYLTHNYITGFNITPPTKTTYRQGEIIDYTGLVIKAVYRNGDEVDVTNRCTISPANGTPFDYYGD